jgi:hypothetical protein
VTLARTQQIGLSGVIMGTGKTPHCVFCAHLPWLAELTEQIAKGHRGSSGGSSTGLRRYFTCQVMLKVKPWIANDFSSIHSTDKPRVLLR